MKKDIVSYPAIFSQDGDAIFVRIPDLMGGFTQGNDIVDAVKMSEDLIGNLLENQTEYPQATEIEPASLSSDEKLVYITTDLSAFRQAFSHTVRKNVTIPEVLNDTATKTEIKRFKGVNGCIKD